MHVQRHAYIHKYVHMHAVGTTSAIIVKTSNKNTNTATVSTETREWETIVALTQKIHTQKAIVRMCADLVV